MFSIIVCSIRPEQAATLERNIASTIGVPFEFIAFDNRGTGKGICAVYNECAERAKYDMLCFLHEDVAFHTQNWGEILAAKLSENDCGVIGFAGGTTKFAYPYGWCSIDDFSCMHYIQSGGRKGPIEVKYACHDDYSKVVTLDGLCQFVRRDVWKKIRYDEVTFPNFHSYDTDFSTAVFVAGYNNYVCNKVLIEHFSLGSFNRVWFDSERTYLKKWGKHLPLFANEESIREQMAKEKRVWDKSLRRLVIMGTISGKEACYAWFRFVRRYPFSMSSYVMPFRILKYKLLHKKYKRMYQ